MSVRLRDLGWLLDSPLHGMADRSLCELSYTGRRTDRRYSLTVGYVATATGIIVLCGHGSAKTWWRNFTAPHAATILLRGRWLPMVGRIVIGAERDEALSAYQTAQPRVRPVDDDPVVVFAVDADRDAADLAPAHLRRRWVASTAAGELAGFTAPAIAGALVAHATAGIAVAALVLAGVFEGAFLGWAQSRVLVVALPGINRLKWIAATAAGAAVAWLVGMLPSTFADTWRHWPTAAVVLAATAAAVVLVGSIGLTQWWVLRKHLDRAWRWIVATALGWCLGLAAFMLIAMPLWRPGQPVVALVAVGLIAAVAMAVVVGVVTSRVLPDPLEPSAGTGRGA